MMSNIQMAAQMLRIWNGALPAWLQHACSVLERGRAVGRTEAGRAVVAGPGRAQVARAAAAVAARRDVEQRARVGVRIRAAGMDGAAVDRVDPGDQRRRDAGAAEHQERRSPRAVGSEHRDAGVGIGDRRDVGDGAPRAPTNTYRY